MKAKIYCLASAKGGSGKTVLCASFAAFLAELGRKVLILDVDAATYGLTLLYLNEVNSRKEDGRSCQNNLLSKGLFDGGGLLMGKRCYPIAKQRPLRASNVFFQHQGECSRNRPPLKVDINS